METIIVLIKHEGETNILGAFASMERAMMAVDEDKKKRSPRPTYRLARVDLGHVYESGVPGETRV